MKHQQENAVFSLNTIFTIVICGQVFNISWKSLISDGPDNFFTRHFKKSKSRIIHIDRSVDTFKLIVRHLRGYSVVAENECQHQDLLNDAYYFGLTKLIKIFKEFVYLNIGGTSFRLRWDLFDKDGPSNYFTGPLKHALLSPHPTLGDSAPIYIERDPEIFKDIIRHLQGYSIHIRDEQHRSKLLDDAEFYLFRRLRDKLKTSIITSDEHHEEILLHLKDVKPNYIEIVDNDKLYYKQNNMANSLMMLTVQLVDFNIACHSNETEVFYFIEQQELRLNKDPTWSISQTIEFDKDCAIITSTDNQSYNLQSYLEEYNKFNPTSECRMHENCNIQWFGIEKAIAKVNANDFKSLTLVLQKILTVGSRIQANMKRDFLSLQHK